MFRAASESNAINNVSADDASYTKHCIWHIHTYNPRNRSWSTKFCTSSCRT